MPGGSVEMNCERDYHDGRREPAQWFLRYKAPRQPTEMVADIERAWHPADLSFACCSDHFDRALEWIEQRARLTQPRGDLMIKVRRL